MDKKKQNGHPLNRRNFLTSTAATVAAFTITKPSQIRGTEANSKIEVGCIGLEDVEV